MKRSLLAIPVLLALHVTPVAAGVLADAQQRQATDQAAADKVCADQPGTDACTNAQQRVGIDSMVVWKAQQDEAAQAATPDPSPAPVITPSPAHYVVPPPAPQPIPTTIVSSTGLEDAPQGYGASWWSF